MRNDTINYYLLFNENNEVMIFYDNQNETFMLPQKEEKTLDETYEDRFYKMNMVLKEKCSDNDVMIYEQPEKLYTRKSPFMSRVMEIISYDGLEELESYNGEYKLTEYSEGRFFLEIKYLLCNYYAKYVELSKEDYNRLKTLCKTYNYEVDFISLEELSKSEDEFANSKSYIRKLENILK